MRPIERVRLIVATAAAGAIADGTRAVGERAIAGAFAAWGSRHANATSASKTPPRCAVSNRVNGSGVVRCDRATHAARAAPDAAAIAGAVLARSGVGGGATQHRSPPRRTARCAHAASTTAAARAAARTATPTAARPIGRASSQPDSHGSAAGDLGQREQRRARRTARRRHVALRLAAC